MNETDRQLKYSRIMFKDVIAEHYRQIDKWGIQSHSLDKWLTITTEEYGELAKAINENNITSIYKESIETVTLLLKIAEIAYSKLEAED